MILKFRLLLIFICFFILLFIPVFIFAQNIQSQVRVIDTKLPQEKRMEVKDLDRKLESYINTYDWIKNNKFNKIIKISVQISMENIVFTFENKFTAKIAVFSSDGSYYGDKYCEFPYNQNDMIEHQDFEFVPVTGLLDHFIYLLLGNEMDKHSLFGGTAYFQKAKEIANSGNYSRYNKWWDRRLRKVEDIIKDPHKPFREMIYNFEQSYSNYEKNENEIAIEFIALTVDFISQLKENRKEDENLQQFFEKNHKRLAEVASLETDGTFIDILTELDKDRESFYKDFKK